MEAEHLTLPSYPASRAAAVSIHPHFARHTAAAPPIETIQAIIDAAFWASLPPRRRLLSANLTGLRRAR